MDTRSNDYEQNKTEETTKQEPFGQPQGEGSLPPPRGGLRYKLSAKWIRVLCFIISGLLIGYGLAAIQVLQACEYDWDIEAAVMGDEQPVKDTDGYMPINAEDIEGVYRNLCIAASDVMRFEGGISDDYIININSAMWGNGAYRTFFDEGALNQLIVKSEYIDYYVSFGDKYYTSISSLKENETKESLESAFNSLGEQYYIRANNQTYSGGKESKLYIDQAPYLSIGASYFDAEDKAHIFKYDNITEGNTVIFEDEYATNKKYTYELTDPNGDTYAEPHIPWYKGNSKYVYDKGSDDYKYLKTLERLDDSGLTVAIGIKHDISAVSAAYINDVDHQLGLSKFIVISLIPIVAVLFVIVIMLMVRCAYNRDTGTYTPSKWLDKRFTAELFAITALLALTAAGVLFTSVSFKGDVSFSDKNIRLFAYLLLAYLGLWYLGFGSVIVLLRKLKTKMFLKTSFTARLLSYIFKGIKSALHKGNERLAASPYSKLSVSRRFLIRNIIFAVLTAVAILFLSVASIEGWDFDTVMLIHVYITAYAIYFLWYFLSSFDYFRDSDKLCEKLENICDGEEYKGTPMSKESPFFEHFKGLDNLDERIKRQTEEMVKSEKTKVELVTNVSHDLKTPLTSIISYIYLLSKEEMSDEAKDYVRILQTKSEKLKAIVNDVFTLAKAASGAEVKNERLDLTMLLNQTIASNQDIIDSSARTVRSNIPQKPIYIMGDGDKLSRVLQNLLDNALKYSLKGTRVFIELKESDEYAGVHFKNTSANEISFTAEEITERFARGDSSRSDGGSGLGLSIAKTFTEACGGEFRVELEGDMFKAVAVFKKAD